MKGKTICPMGSGEHSYRVHGVTFIVKALFMPISGKTVPTTIRNRMQHSLKSGFADLTFDEPTDNMNAQGYSCSEADRGKEETNE